MKKFFLLFCMVLLVAALPAMAEGTLTLPEDLTSIEAEAFYGDTSLGDVILPEGVTAIGERAFADSSVKSIALPSTLTDIDPTAFENCEGLTAYVESGSTAEAWCAENSVNRYTYSVSDGEATITGYAGSETELTFPAEINGYPVTTIGNGAFKSNTQLTAVTVPVGVKKIDRDAFSARPPKPATSWPLLPSAPRGASSSSC